MVHKKIVFTYYTELANVKPKYFVGIIIGNLFSFQSFSEHKGLVKQRGMKKLIFNQLISSILFALFLWQSLVATFKFLDRKTYISSENVDNFSILFPSITICKSHLNGIHGPDLSNKSFPMEHKISILHENTWKKNETIYFLSHSKMFNTTFPCNTIEGATDGGKPCSFPYFEPYNEGLQTSCSKPTNYCYTRYDFNLTSNTSQ